MDLDELAVRQPHDAAGFAAVQGDLAVLALQGQGDALRDDERDDRADEEQRPQPVGHIVQRHVEVRGDEVRAGSCPHDAVPDEAGHADGGTGRSVARTVQDVVLAVVLGDPAFDPRVGEQHGEDDACRHQGREQHVEREDLAEPDLFDAPVSDGARHQAQGAIHEPDVPVRLGSRRDGGGVVGTVVPDRVDGEEPCHEGDDTEHDEEEAAGLGSVYRAQRVADDVAVVASRAGVLGVLVHDHHKEVHDDHQQDERRNQQDVEHVQAADDDRAGEFSAEEEERDLRADHRDGLDHAVDDAEAVAGEQVIGERVAGEAGSHREDEQHAAHHPVHFARLAECAGEEDPEHVHGRPTRRTAAPTSGGPGA